MSEERVATVEPENEIPGAEQENRRKPKFAVLAVVALLLVAGAVITLVLRLGEQRALAKETEELARPTVIVHSA